MARLFSIWAVLQLAAQQEALVLGADVKTNVKILSPEISFAVGNDGKSVNLVVALAQQLEKETNLNFSVENATAPFDTQQYEDECRRKMASATGVNACLVMKTATAFENTTEDVVGLAPTLVFQKPERLKRNSLTFVNVFHSSVWSFLLLSVLLTLAALIGCEVLHPFGYGLARRWNLSDPRKLRWPEAVWAVLGGVMMKSHARLPASAAGAVLLGFWAAFSLCAAVVFAGGLLAAVAADSEVAARPTHADYARLEASCPPASRFCRLARAASCGVQQPVEWCRARQRLQIRATATQTDGHTALLTDSSTARHLTDADANLTAIRVGPGIAALALLTGDRALRVELSRGLLRLRERGVDLSAQFTTPDRTAGPGAQWADLLPIRLGAMLSLFLLLLAGYVIAAITLVAEFCYRTFVSKDYKTGQAEPETETDGLPTSQDGDR